MSKVQCAKYFQQMNLYEILNRKLNVKREWTKHRMRNEERKVNIQTVGNTISVILIRFILCLYVLFFYKKKHFKYTCVVIVGERDGYFIWINLNKNNNFYHSAERSIGKYLKTFEYKNIFYIVTLLQRFIRCAYTRTTH